MGKGLKGSKVKKPQEKCCRFPPVMEQPPPPAPYTVQKFYPDSNRFKRFRYPSIEVRVKIYK